MRVICNYYRFPTLSRGVSWRRFVKVKKTMGFWKKSDFCQFSRHILSETKNFQGKKWRNWAWFLRFGVVNSSLQIEKVIENSVTRHMASLISQTELIYPNSDKISGKSIWKQVLRRFFCKQKIIFTRIFSGGF